MGLSAELQKWKYVMSMLHDDVYVNRHVDMLKLQYMSLFLVV